MRLTCLQENLKRALATVGRAVAGKSTLPVLAHVLLTTDGSRLKVVATNLEVAITHWIGAQIHEPGGITVPAKLLTDVVGNLPNEPITLTLDPRTQTVKLDCGRFTTNIKGIEADEFPAIPTVAGLAPAAILPAEVLRGMIRHVAFAAATDDTRPVLAGVLVRLDAYRLSMQAADGFRAATRTVTLVDPAKPVDAFIVPARAMIELERLTAGDESAVSVTVAPGASQVLFHTPTTELVSRLIDGTFPDVDRIIPKQYTTRTILDVAALSKAVKLASFFASASQNVVKLTLTPADEGTSGTLVISANAAEVGDNTGEVDALVHGAGGQIALNVVYLAELLAAVTTAQIALETQTPQSPAVFTLVGEDGYMHIIMPMSIR